MNKKMSKRQKDIKSKLMAAICMLLVSSIMMVSTTYAWFTLSTAPEVTGISTAVGANGNLEMALMPLSGDTDDITSNVGDSINNTGIKTESNVTWGNLVDLKDAYGLENITLYPSALNADETSGAINTAFPVSIPEYGVDGRVSALNATKAVPGYYTAAGTFLDSALAEDGTAIENPRGVRAIGVASGASPAQLAYKAAIMKASQAATNAKNKASGILVEKGGALADIAIRHVNGEGNETYTAADITNLTAMMNAIYGSETEPGALLIIRNAIKEYIVADYISKNSEGYEDQVATIRALTTIDANADYIPSGMVELIGKLNTAINTAKTAQEAIPSGKDTYTWDDVSAVVNQLAVPGMMNLNGFAISDLTNHVNELMQDVMNGKGITLYLQTGAGIFVDIADFCGDYSAPVTIAKIEHSALPAPLENVKATMQTQTDVDPVYLTVAKNAVADAPGNAGEGALPLSDFYGYIIDLAFRTNVADSNLQLQTAAVDRIYTDSTTNEATMGGGSTMIFKSSDTNFTADRMIELMKHLKVVLFDPANGTVVKNLVISNVPTEIITDPDGTVTAPLYVADATGAPATRQKMENGTGVVDTDGNPVMEKDPTIMALDQNTIYQLSALVYLDGTTLTNADVANAAQSMVGALNLQFSSSAELVPMEYADLRNGTVAAPEGGNTPVVKNVTTGSITGGYAADIKHVAVGDTYKLVAVITETAGSTPVTTGTVTIGGESATYATAGGVSGWVVDATETVPAEAVDVTVGA